MITDQLVRLLAPDVQANYGPGDDRFYGSPSVGSMAGELVTPDTALQVDAFFACLRVITETVGFDPWIVYKRLPNGGRERAPEHPLYAKLHDQPNRWQTAFEWKEMMAGHIILRGHAYNEIVSGESGPFDQFVPLHPDRVKEEKLPSGDVRYKVRDERGAERTLTYDQVFHVPGLWGGKSILEAARDNLGEAIAAQNYSSRSLQNGVRPSGTLNHPATFSNADVAKRIRDDWQSSYAGPANAGKTVILEEGMEWHAIGMTNDDAQFVQTRAMSVPSIARRFRMPLTMIGYESNTSNFGTGVEQYQIGFVQFTMLPWFGRFESRANIGLVVDPQTYYTEFLVDALLRGDQRTRYDSYRLGITTGFLSRNEVRLRENLNPGPDDLDEFLQPVSLAEAPFNPGGGGSRAPGASDPRAERYARVLAGQVVRKENAEIKKLATRYADDGLGWETAVRDFYTRLGEEISERCYIEPGAAARYCAEARDTLIDHGVLSIEGAGEGKGDSLTALMLGRAEI